MSVLRFFAVCVVFGLATVAWMILGGTISYRTADLKDSLAAEVDNQWGPSSVSQKAPAVVSGGKSISPQKSEVAVNFDHQNRYKGLLWFSTYSATFNGAYTVQSSGPGSVELSFPLPLGVRDERSGDRYSSDGGKACTLESMVVTVDDKPVAIEEQNSAGALNIPFPADGQAHVVKVSYKTCGRDRWTYLPSRSGNAELVRNLTLKATTNFTNIDYPKGTVSPISPAQAIDGGMAAVWQYVSIRMGSGIGIEMPSRPDSGPIAARMSFFAPVSLLFFFTVLFAVVVLKRISLHPMHYLFISGGFFAFHILLAYLVDVINIHAAFWLCSAVSLVLVVSYMRLVAGLKFAATYVALAQLVFLIGFSYAFFWEGRTGLTVAVLAVITLFILMQATARVNWNVVFGRRANVPIATQENVSTAKPPFLHHQAAIEDPSAQRPIG